MGFDLGFRKKQGVPISGKIFRTLAVLIEESSEASENVNVSPCLGFSRHVAFGAG